MASIPLPFIRRKVQIVTAYDKKDLPAVMSSLASEKKTGALTIHLTNGSIGAVEWNEREKTA